MPTMEMRRFFGKGPLLSAIDALSAGLDANALLGILPLLESSTEALATLALRFGLTSRDVARHLERDWFGGWWTELQPIEPIVRGGIAQAVRLSLFEPESGAQRKQPLPIDALWLSGVDRVEAGVAASPRQVTLVLFTPPVPAAQEGSMHALDPVWMVHRGEPRGDEEVVAAQGDLVTTRIRTRLRPPAAS